MTCDNDLLVDVRKIAYGKLFWMTDNNGYLCRRKDKPKTKTFRGQIEGFDDILPATDEFPKETRYERLLRRKCVMDVWVPRLVITLNNGHTLEFTKEAALKIWSAYKGYIYNRK